MNKPFLLFMSFLFIWLIVDEIVGKKYISSVLKSVFENQSMEPDPQSFDGTMKPIPIPIKTKKYN